MHCRWKGLGWLRRVKIISQQKTRNVGKMIINLLTLRNKNIFNQHNLVKNMLPYLEFYIIRPTLTQFHIGYPYKWEHHSVKYVYSMIIFSEHCTYLCGIEKCGSRLNSGETERERGRETKSCSKRALAWGNKLECWTNIHGSLEKG